VFSGIARDMTGRKRAELELRKARRRGAGQPGEKRISRQHEPRDPHAVERVIGMTICCADNLNQSSVISSKPLAPAAICS